MTLEVTCDLKFELSGLNNPCNSASLASLVLHLTNLPRKKERSQISSLDMHARTSPQVKMHTSNRRNGSGMVKRSFTHSIELDFLRYKHWVIYFEQDK